MSSPWTLYALQICEESQKEHLDLYSLHHHPILLWEDLSHNSSRPLCGMYCCALRIPDETIAYPPHPTPHPFESFKTSVLSSSSKKWILPFKD